MNRTLFIYLGLVVVPACALAFFAFGVADRDYDEGARRLDDRLEAEADALARRVDASITDAAKRAENDLGDAVERVDAGLDPDFARPVLFVVDGVAVGHALGDVAPRKDSTVDVVTRRLFELSLRGGQSYEHVHHDLERAFDAYVFYLPRIADPRLRDVLRFHGARVALAGERRSTGLAMLAALDKEESPAMTREGLPVALLAAELLLREGALDEGTIENVVRLRDRLRRWAPRLEHATLAHYAARFGSGDAVLRGALAAREKLSDAVSRVPEMLAALDAALLLDGDARSVLRAREIPVESGRRVRVIARAKVELPNLDVGELEATIVSGNAARGDAAPDQPTDRVVREIRLGGDSGPLLARLVVTNPNAAGARAELASRRRMHRVFVGALIVLTIGAGMALLRLVFRERHLVRLRANLLANVSHELKTPVTSIRMFSEMLADDPTDPARTSRFGRLLQSESLRLTRIIDNVMDFARLGRGEVALDREPVDLDALTERIANDFEPRAREQGVEFQRSVSVEDDAVALANAPAVERILINLLENALKYRGASEPRIDLGLETNGSRLFVTVRDNGIGIPERDQERIFEEFYRVRYEDYGVQGSGLGLSIARRLARVLGGDIGVESRDGGGSSFRLELPRSPSEDPPDPESREEA